MTVRLNTPNKITLGRIFVLPLLVLFLISPSRTTSFLAALVFALSSFSDWLDGHLARKTAQITTLGKLLDPIADKLLLTAALIPLVALGRVAAWMAVILIGREIAVTGLRGIAAERGYIIAASSLGKYKTICEIVSILFLILYYHWGPISFPFLGTLFLWAAMILSLVSGIDYFNKFWNRFPGSPWEGENR